MVGALSAVATVPAARAAQTASAPEASAALGTESLRQVLQDQALPTTELIPTTRKSHPWNGAAWQNVPIDLAKRGYVEKEYYLSGVSNVYEWIPYTDYATKVAASGPYTTRMDVRMPKDMDDWSGNVVVEIINMSAGYDWTAIWSAVWQRVLKDGDVYVGITSKPNVLPGLLRFDRTRYKRLNWANPVPAAQQTCGKLPHQKNYDANLSRLYENGLVYDILSQAGRLLKSSDAGNPLGRPATQVLLSGESQSASLLLTYYRYFSRAAQLASGQPVYDGYLAETMVDIHSDLRGLIPGDRISQCAPPLPKTTRRTPPSRTAALLGWGSTPVGTTPASGSGPHLPTRQLDEPQGVLGARWQQPWLGVAVRLRRRHQEGPSRGRLLGPRHLRLVVHAQQPRGAVPDGREGGVRAPAAVGGRRRRSAVGTENQDPRDQ